MTALWAAVPVEHGDVTATRHLRIPVTVVTVTPAQAFLGLGA